MLQQITRLRQPQILQFRIRNLQSVNSATAIALLLSLLWPTAATTQELPQLEPPPLVRFTGALHPLEEKGRGGLSTLTVSVKETKWIFKVAKIEKLTGTATSDLRLLESLFPAQLRFIGPDALLDLLQAPEIAGKSLTIEGRLYVGDRMLFLTAVVEGQPQL